MGSASTGTTVGFRTRPAQPTTSTTFEASGTRWGRRWTAAMTARVKSCEYRGSHYAATDRILAWRDPMQLEGKTAIVTGGSSGIGYAIASAYVDEGANVVVANRNVDDGEAAANELGCTFVRTDVSDYEQVSALVDVTVEEFGALDVIVNNAGVGSESSVGDMTLEEWHRVVDVDLSGVMYGTKAALPHLLESEGFVVNVASIYGLVGGRGAAAYSAAKGGVVNFTQQVAVDYAEAGLNVNSICPGFVETPMTSELLESDRFYEILLDETPMNRPAQPEEIAPLAVFLASEGATYVTGANIPVDGGWTAH